jgi:hypothetical protein
MLIQMRHRPHTAKRWGVFLSLVGIAAQALVSEAAPVPPRQSQPWTPTTTNLPSNLKTAVDFVFQTGMADPRDCDYREIEILVGTRTQTAGVVVKTRGWMLPAPGNAATNYGIGWNGQIYPLKSIGKPANAEDDARSTVRVMTEIMTKNKGIGSIGSQVCTSEDYSVGTRWLTPMKAAMLLRFAPADVAEACARLIERDEPFLLLATDRLWTMYDRATCAHLRGDDDLAYELALNLTQAQNDCEAEAKARGVRFDQRLEPDPRFSKAEGYFPFLDPLPLLLEDQQRRHHRASPLRDPAKIDDKAERIAALIGQLENLTPQADGNFPDYDPLKNATVQALVREGWEAVGPLIECYENDHRLTRVIPYSMVGGPFSSRSHRVITSVREPAYVAIENILETTQFARDFSGNVIPEKRQAIYQRTAAAMRAYWNRFKDVSREERLYAILQDDHGRWFEAASILVQPTNNACVPSARWNYPWGLSVDLNDKTPMRGEALRTKTNPSVAELLIKRMEGLAAFSAGKTPVGGTVDDASDLNGACDLAFCLTKWDPHAGTETIRKLTDLALKKLNPQTYCSLSSHMTLSAQLPALISIRARAG